MTAPSRTRPRASSGPVELHLLGEVGAWGTTAADFIDQLRAAGGRDVVLHVSSPGGDLIDGLAMFHALRGYGGHTTAYIGALCASAATVVALGCDDRVTAPGGQWMCHRPWVGTVGDIDDHKAAVDVLARFGGVLADIYADRTGTGTAALWETVMAATTWFGPQESVAAGLSHRVGDVSPVEAAARRQVHALRAQYRGPGRAAAAVRAASTRGMVAAARRSRTPDVAQLVLAGIRDGLRRPNLSELLVAALRDGTR